MNTAYQLVIRKGPKPGQIFPLSAITSTVGRDPISDISINDPEVSRQHARFTQTSDSYQIEDLQSTNGTFVNGIQIGATPVQLAHGNEIQFGSSVVLIFELAVDEVIEVAEADFVGETAVPLPPLDEEEIDPMLPPEFDEWADPDSKESIITIQEELDQAFNEDLFQEDVPPSPSTPRVTVTPSSALSRQSKKTIPPGA